MRFLRHCQPPNPRAAAAAILGGLAAACGGEVADATRAAAARTVAVSLADSMRGEPGRCLVVARTLGSPDAAEGEELPWAIYQALITAGVLVDSAGLATQDTAVALLAFDAFLERDSLRIVRATMAVSPPGRTAEIRQRRMEWRLACVRGECRIVETTELDDARGPRPATHTAYAPCRT